VLTPEALDPYQNVAVLCPLGIVTFVTDAVANWVVPKDAPFAALLDRFTVSASLVVIGAPEPV
jgi:hypothetical protein